MNRRQADQPALVALAIEARESILALAKAARRQPIDGSTLSIRMQIVFRENISA
jgi:hypothetical protein